MVQGIKSNVRKGRRRRLLRCHPLEQGFVARRKSLLRAQTPHRGPLKRLPVAPASISKLSYRGRRKKPAAKVPAFPGKPERPECWFAVRPLRYSDVLGSLLRNRRRWSKKRLWRRENYLGNSNRAARNGVSGRYISARLPCSRKGRQEEKCDPGMNRVRGRHAVLHDIGCVDPQSLGGPYVASRA